MPLDAGSLGPQPADGLLAERPGFRGPTPVTLDTDGDVGAALRAARERLGLAIEDIAQATRVRAAHIASLEAYDFAALPARPFVIGYVRAYARALGLETEAVVARFRAEAPSPDDRLRPPGGLRGQSRHRRYGWIAGAAVALLLAVVAWNVVRHVQTAPRPSASAAPRLIAPHPAPGPARVGAPLPAPPEADAPPAYQTPGLAGPPAAPAADPPGSPFVPGGAIYGAASGPGVVLQARKPTSLIVRGADGAVQFARQLAGGEAWRAPAGAGLIADVGNPASVEVFVGGVSKGDLVQPRTPLASLSDAPAGAP